jgi:hypothetical protein
LGCWYRWQICQIFSTCLFYYLKVSKRNNENFFWLKIFSICHRCQPHWWCTLSCEYLCNFSKKFETALIVYSEGLGGNWFMKKTRSRKSHDTVSLNS